MRTKLDTIRETIEKFNRGPIETRTLSGDLALKIRLALTREWPEGPEPEVPDANRGSVRTAIRDSIFDAYRDGVKELGSVGHVEILTTRVAIALVKLQQEMPAPVSHPPRNERAELLQALYLLCPVGMVDMRLDAGETLASENRVQRLIDIRMFYVRASFDALAAELAKL